MSIFTNLKDAEMYTGSTRRYFDPGAYELSIVENKIIQTREKGPAFVAEFEILWSNNGVKVGELRNWYVPMLKRPSQSNLKSYFIAAIGLNWTKPEDQERAKKEVIPRLEEIAEAAVGDQQYLRGFRIALLAQKTETKDHREFTRHGWMPAGTFSTSISAPSAVPL